MMAFWLQMTWEGTALGIAGAGFFFNAGVAWHLARKAVTRADLLEAIGKARAEDEKRFVAQGVCEATHKSSAEMMARLQREVNGANEGR